MLKLVGAVHELATLGGRNVTLHEMKNVEHAFPDSSIPALRRWLARVNAAGS
ncbi:MAG: hypothetical protein JXR37_18275 [Kiritimatiellae bacterium]|nr:hypothetical protein [Kiritimatiellia bacterium]